MRVLLVSHRYPPESVAGVELYTQRLAAELVKGGDTVSVVTRHWGPAPPAPLVPQTVRERPPDGTTVYRFVGGNYVGGEVDFTLFLRDHECLEQLFTAALVEAAPEVVHFNHLVGLSPRFIPIARRLGAAVVVSLHDLYFACPLFHLRKKSGELCAGPDGGRECGRTCFASESPETGLRWGLRTVYYRRILGMAHRMVSGSRYIASFFEQFAPGDAGVRVVPNGVAVEPADPATLTYSTPKERGRLTLAYFGTIIRHKGAHVILEALRGGRVGPVDLLILGQCPDPTYIRKLRQMAAAVPDLTFRLLGPFKQSLFPTLLQGVDCVVMPSLVPEAGPQVPREAMARGIPVLGSRLGAVPEIVLDGENGFTFDPNRPGELAAILRRLVREDGLLGRLREGVLRTPVVTVAQHSRMIREVYEEALAELAHRNGFGGPEAEEVGFLHETLVSLGLGAPQ
jgi:glycosyltransferase involved in cell wall biosynthesis